MASPFPGMNPYLEHPDVWHDFHEAFILASRDAVVAQVRPHFIVKVDQHVYIHDLSQDERVFIGRSDAYVAQRSDDGAKNGGVATIAAPAWATVPVQVDQEHISFLEIRDREDRELVTVIELLSPTNKKPGPDRDDFIAKRKRYLAAGVHYVEIDLLRAWPRMPMEQLAVSDYCVMVSRWEMRPKVGVWPIRLRDPLPVIPIPLRGAHADARLDLKAVLDRVYDASGYEDYIYVHKPQPPLHPDDQVWADGLLPRHP